MKVSELPVGTKIKLGRQRFSNKAVNGEEDIIWIIVGFNRSGQPTNSATLITERIIRYMPYDAREPNKPYDTYSRDEGNIHYGYSNIRQWLNSTSRNGEWFTTQHEYDEPPINELIYTEEGYNYYPYDTDAGFLYLFSQKERDSILNTRVKWDNNMQIEYYNDKIFLPSTSEITNYDGKGENSNIVPAKYRKVGSTPMAFLNSIDPNDGDKNTHMLIWTRTTVEDGFNSKPRVYIYNPNDDTGSDYYDGFILSKPYISYGLRPMCNLSQDTELRLVEGTTDTYEIIPNTKPTIEIRKLDNGVVSFTSEIHSGVIKEINIVIDGEIISTIEVNNNNISKDYVINLNDVKFGDNLLSIQSVSELNEITYKNFNVNVENNTAELAIGSRIIINDMVYRVDGVSNKGSVIEVTLNKDLETPLLIDDYDYIEIVHSEAVPYAAINNDKEKKVEFKELKLKSVKKRNRDIIEEYESDVDIGDNVHIKMILNDRSRINNIYQILWFHKDKN